MNLEDRLDINLHGTIFQLLSQIDSFRVLNYVVAVERLKKI